MASAAKVKAPALTSDDVLAWLGHDAPEYEQRKARKFVPPTVSIKDVHAAIPRHLFERNTVKGVFYVVRHVALSALFYAFATRTDLIAWRAASALGWGASGRSALGWACWVLYWFWQSVSFAGMWTLGHECGHDAISPHAWVNIACGMGLHTFMLTPYFAWRLTHRAHHKGTNHLSRDETYHPMVRSDFKNLPDVEHATKMDYKEILEETPGFTLFKMVIRQFLGFQLYLIHNRKGNPKYPPWTSHYNPDSKLFKPQDRNAIIVSDIAIGCMLVFLTTWSYFAGFHAVWSLYFTPWLWAHSWIVMFTYLQHSDPTVPYYREKTWTFARGALATVDRPVFGWIGEFFWHGIAHHHVAHHFFVNVPFYNLAQVTKAIKPVLGEYYCYDSTPTIYALWRSFTQCTFIEDEGDVVFFKNQRGEVGRECADAASTARDAKPAKEEKEADALAIAGLTG
ncbi:fatty acid desaturase-domain-containing protein [Epithele typhae]|uniref:fatty acid desaturase-domain-containing protein n=1 Tax=Epithele typhae TaxID=378194 RepID=UPI0020085D27|nr:fatty acid desaturase-domain-containing protein [Epithele typhae]KAH9910878.1 fatty acid desaturase-domain-containing protein [Epithele typhae]